MLQRTRRPSPHPSSNLFETLECRTLFSAVSTYFGPNLALELPKKQPPTHRAAQSPRKFADQTVLAMAAAGTGAPALLGDVNGDGVVDISDLNFITSHWEAIVPPGTGGDLNGNGIVDISDLNLVTSHWQQHLPAPTIAPPSSYNWQTQVINGVLNVWAPNPSDFGPTWIVTDPNALFGGNDIPSINAIQQGQTADCYFLSSIGSLALDHPATIMQDVQNDPGGGWQVTFQYTNPSGFTAPIIFHTDDELSTTWQTEADGQVWSLVMEKAYAAFRTWNGATSTNTMASLDWGYPVTALTQLGEPSQAIYTWALTPQAIYNTIANDVANHLPILFQTTSTAPTMIQSHVYVITGDYTDPSGTAWVTLYNPWGFYDTRTETDLLQNGIGSITVGLT